MANKVVLSIARELSREGIASRKKSVAEAFGICPDDVIVLSEGMTVSVVDVPDAMLKAKENADKDAAKAAKAAEVVELPAGEPARAEKSPAKHHTK